MPEKYTRREFSKIAGATATFQLGGDDDEDGILSRIFGDEEESSSNTEGAVYVDVENELESVNPGPNEVFITTDTERIFKPTDDGKWTEFASLGGDSPWVENADGALTPENGEPVNVDKLSPSSGVPYTIYVRSSGSDSNDGLSSGSAVASISTAIERLTSIPIQNEETPAYVINIESGATFAANEEVLTIPWANKVALRSSGSGNAILEVPSGAKGLKTWRSRLVLQGITMQEADTANPPSTHIQAEHQTTVEVRDGSELMGASNWAVHTQGSCFAKLRADGSLVDGKGNGGDGFVAYQNSTAVVGGTIQNCDRGVFADRNGSAIITGTIDGCSTGMFAADGGVIRTTDASTVTNNSTAAHAELWSFVNFATNTTVSGNTTLVDPGPLGAVGDNAGNYTTQLDTIATDGTLAIGDGSTVQVDFPDNTSHIRWPSQGGTAQPRIGINSNGEVYAEDDDGNRTLLT